MAKKNPLIASFHYTNGSSWIICNCLHEQQKSGTWSARPLGRWTKWNRTLNSGHKHEQQQPPQLWQNIFYVNRKTTHLSRRVFFIQHILDWVPIKLPDDTIHSCVCLRANAKWKTQSCTKCDALSFARDDDDIYMKRDRNMSVEDE